MKLRQIRNATLLLSVGEHCLLVDPMLADAGAMPGFKMFGGGRRNNPLVALPPQTSQWLEEVTAVVLTHEHPDHFDQAALRWLRERQLPIYANAMDAGSLERKGLNVKPLDDGALGMGVEIVPSRHGRGLLGWMMGPVAGYYLAHPSEPSVYLIGDSIMTESVLDAMKRLQPDVIVAPAGAANMGLGGNILFSVDELVTLATAAPGVVVFNHLEALDHCPTTRAGLADRMRAEGLDHKTHIPADGEALSFGAARAATPPAIQPTALRPGFQKWLTAHFAGT